eukprot:1892224-Amphidinium_carterae.1
MHLSGFEHTGIAISVYCFDRGALGGLKEHLVQKHMLMSGPRFVDEGLNMKELLDWTICLPCSHHDLHNGLKWALGGLMGDPG